MFSACIVQFYFSKKARIVDVMLALIGFLIMVKFGRVRVGHLQLLSIMLIIVWLYYIPYSLLWNYSVVQYTWRHSFDLYFIMFNAIIFDICYMAFEIQRWGAPSASDITGLLLMLLMCLTLMHQMFNFEAVPISPRMKQMVIMMCAVFSFIGFVVTLYNWRIADYFVGIDVQIESLDVTISLRDMLLMSLFNIGVFWFKKFIMMTNHPHCILVATYSRVVWISSGMRQQTLSSFGRRRTRAGTISLDIYKQSIAQGTDVFLFEDNSIAHNLCNPETAEQLHQIHFSKRSLIGIIIAAATALGAIPLSIDILAIIAEIFCILILLVGPFTFDAEMMKFYLKSFDFWYKWYNWIMYLCAYSVWTNHQYVMANMAWTEFALRNLVITLTMFYIFAVDAYHVPERNKKRALLILIVVAIYFYVCIFWRLHFLHPRDHWEDWDIELPLMQVNVSLRGMMMSSMGNLIIFMIKQLVLMALHPGVAAFELYPKVTWIGDEEEDQGRPPLEET